MGAAGIRPQRGLGLTGAEVTDAPDPVASVSAIVITYRPDLRMLERCLTSLATSRPRPLEVVLVDNSPESEEVGRLARAALAGEGAPELVFLAQGRNLGYAAATNAGVSASSGDLVLLLNPDATLGEGALGSMVAAAAANPEALGFAPKILLTSPAYAIDSVGMALGEGAEGTQRGLGQVDAGQYDRPERVAGLCFAGALIRRPGFFGARVGPLDERYFMFYEDVDWSLRATVLGEWFLTVPAAVVVHFHSASTRSLGQGFKIRLIQRNLIWTAIKNLELEPALRVLIRRSLANLRWAARGRHPGASIRAVLEAWAGLPEMLSARRELQRRRRRRDREVLGLEGQASFFDVDRYEPDLSAAALVAVIGRLYALRPSPELQGLLLRLQSAENTGLGRDRRLLAAMVRESGIVLGPGLTWMVAELER